MRFDSTMQSAQKRQVRLKNRLRRSCQILIFSWDISFFLLQKQTIAISQLSNFPKYYILSVIEKINVSYYFDNLRSLHFIFFG